MWRWLLLGLLLGALSVVATAAPGDVSLLIEPKELTQSLDQVRVLDLRPAKVFRQGHIPGAVHCSVRRLDNAEANRQGLPVPLEDARALFHELGIDADRAVLVYDDQGGRFAARFFYFAEFFGHPQVRVLNGGWTAWRQSGGAVETEARPVPAGTFQPRANHDRIATAEWIRQRLEQHENPIVLDARSPEEYSGEVVTAGPRGGHIPGARNLDWREAIAANGRFKPAKELRGLLRERGLDFDREVVTYCNSGTRSSHLYFVLRLLGHPKVRNYDGSWKDWGSRRELPTEKE